MNIERRKRKLTVMLIPHSGSQIKAMELTRLFFVCTISVILLLIASAMFFTYKFVSTKMLLERNIEYVSSRNNDLEKIEKEVLRTSEMSNRFIDELSRTKSLFRNASFGNNSIEEESIQSGDFAQALDVSSQNYDDVSEVVTLMSLSKELETNLPLLEGMNDLVENQRSLFKNLPVYWPVDGSVITMEWGPNIHPVYGTWYIHKGFDFGAVPGAPVKSAANGEVTYVGYDLSYGLHIYVTHPYGFKTHYSHLSSISVKRGQEIQQGQVIGKVGATGLVTGPHLDFQIYLGNELIDPGVYLRVLHAYDRPKGNR